MYTRTCISFLGKAQFQESKPISPISIVLWRQPAAQRGCDWARPVITKVPQKDMSYQTRHYSNLLKPPNRPDKCSNKTLKKPWTSLGSLSPRFSNMSVWTYSHFWHGMCMCLVIHINSSHKYVCFICISNVHVYHIHLVIVTLSNIVENLSTSTFSHIADCWPSPSYQTVFQCRLVSCSVVVDMLKKI